MMKKSLYSGMFLVLLSCLCYRLTAGEIKLVKQVSLDDLGILKPTLMKVHLGNTYIFDEAGMSFFIINNELKVIKKFGRCGLGPAEYRQPVEFGFFNNRLWVTDVYGKIIQYDLEGEFIEEKKPAKTLSLVLEQIDADRYVVLENQVENNRDIIKRLIFAAGSEKITLVEIKETFQLTVDLEKKITFLFSATKNSCYVVPSDKRYYIRRFDINKKVFAGEIEKKDFQGIKYNEKEIAEIKERKEKMLASNPGMPRFDIKFPVWKPAVKQIYSDEMERLYIVSPTSREGKNFLEIYDKTLKYQDGYLIPATASNLFFPASDFIYLVICDEEEEIYRLQVYYPFVPTIPTQSFQCAVPTLRRLRSQ